MPRIVVSRVRPFRLPVPPGPPERLCRPARRSACAALASVSPSAGRPGCPVLFTHVSRTTDWAAPVAPVAPRHHAGVVQADRQPAGERVGWVDARGMRAEPALALRRCPARAALMNRGFPRLVSRAADPQPASGPFRRTEPDAAVAEWWGKGGGGEGGGGFSRRPAAQLNVIYHQDASSTLALSSRGGPTAPPSALIDPDENR